jgi:hypothetical protein
MADHFHLPECTPEERRSGRPKGSKNKLGKGAIQQLAEAEFNPLTQLLQLYQACTEEIETLKGKDKVTMTLAQLRTNQRIILEVLMKYAYVQARPDEIQEQREPVRIILEMDDGPRESNS